MQSTKSLVAKHQETLEQACEAVLKRGHWSPYPEVPSGKYYGETANADGKLAFEAVLNQRFELSGPETGADTEGTFIGEECSPYGIELGINYQQHDVDSLISSAGAALAGWRNAGAEVRTAVCLEILERLNRRSFEIGYGTMHTTGQGFAMAFQAAGPHAQDRGLEAVAQAWLAMEQVPSGSVWHKPQGKHEPFVMRKRYHVVPRGISLVIACSTFPTWNTYPGLFASLVTGNPVIIKPHPQAVLPVAITVQTAQQVLQEFGFDPNLVMMAVDSAANPITQKLALHCAIRLIDYTGGNSFADWLTGNAHQARLFIEKAGVNSVLIDSVDQVDRVCQNLAFSLCLYSGQMCTTPQAILIPRDGIDTGNGRISFYQLADAITSAIEKLLSDPDRAAMILGMIPSGTTVARLQQAVNLGRVVLESKCLPHPEFSAVSYRTPLILAVEGEERQQWMQERFGPIAFLVATDGLEQSLSLVEEAISSKGAITLSVYSTDEEVLERAEQVAIERGVALSCNLDSGVYVNQSAAFSDYHATGNNPAANTSLTDMAFVADRFAVVQSRRHEV
ncbi:phenylacetic acid degradation protein PaaN [Motiliproteus sp. MSK22-1]|uniref:phenylacetic acid degradation protein PaaN n=1 Tax=Motiliproteus sp. MSK22-1 TaxID=1897630 RepID=UPI0009753FCB|nr:phenylacetic acid degradation protein PaaN [Motiliproteus sp. MSK22-1]OMH38342.1 phenylacetic acid degradation protein PaaN [Motiliproteus sp. MSK22-1]